MKVVAFLQNPWSPAYAGRKWPQRSWLRALRASRTGARLRHFVAACPSASIHWDNASPEVGPTPDSIYPPDYEHVGNVLERVRPRVVVAFGVYAGLALRQFRCASLLILPHPTYRVVTNALLAEGGRLLEEGFEGVVELKQRVGSVELVTA